MVLNGNTDVIKQHQLVHLCNVEALCFLLGTD
jgi:hypothetical protein